MLTPKEAKDLIDRVGPHIDSRFDYTETPKFPEGRDDVAAVRRFVENGTSYGYDTIYVVWKTSAGELRHTALTDSASTKAYLFIRGVRMEGDRIIVSLDYDEYAHSIAC